MSVKRLGVESPLPRQKFLEISAPHKLDLVEFILTICVFGGCAVGYAIQLYQGRQLWFPWSRMDRDFLWSEGPHWTSARQGSNHALFGGESAPASVDYNEDFSSSSGHSQSPTKVRWRSGLSFNRAMSEKSGNFRTCSQFWGHHCMCV